MVDCREHLDAIAAAERGGPVKVCIDVDAGWRARRSYDDRREALAAARSRRRWRRSRARSSRGRTCELDGLMAYEGQIAGVGDRPPGKPLMRARAADRAGAVRARAGAPARGDRRRGALGRAAALRQRRRHRLDRAHRRRAGRDRGRRGLRACSARRCSTPTARSRPRPAALFALPVVRKPSPKLATALGGGYPASGAAGRDRLPRPFLPARPEARRAARARARCRRRCSAGGRRAAGRRPRLVPPRQGGRAVRALRRRAPVRGGEIVETVPTYRGEGKTFL